MMIQTPSPQVVREGPQFNVACCDDQTFRALADKALSPVVRYDSNCKRIYVNQALADLTGLSIEALLNTKPTESVFLHEASKYEDKIRQVFKQGAKDQYAYTGSSKGGENIATFMTLLPERDHEGRVKSVLAISNTPARNIKADQQREMLVFAFNQTNTKFFLVGEDGRFSYVNEQACRSLEYSKGELLSLSLEEIAPGWTPGIWSGYWQKLVSNKSLTFEAILRTKNGRRFPVEISATYLVFHEQEYVLALVKNISERKRQEEKELKQAAWVYNNSSEAMMIVNSDMRITAVNPAFITITGYQPEEVIGHTPKVLASGYHDSAFYSAMSQAIIETGHWEGEVWSRRKNGDLFLERLSISTAYDENEVENRYIAQFTDITRQKDSETMLRALSAKHIADMDEEGKRIAREIHDELGQRMTLLKMDTLALRNVDPGNTALLNEIAQRMSNTIDASLRIIRDIASEVRPPALDVGILLAIEGLLEEFHERTQIEYRWVKNILRPLNLTDHQEIGIYRIVQESLTNIMRHSGATYLEVHATSDEEKLCFEVVDNGEGFDLDHSIIQKYGLLGMRERAAILNGELTIRSAPGEGTAVRICIPQ